MLHEVTKPTTWRGGASHLKTPQADAAEGTGKGACYEQRQVGRDVQDEDAPRENREKEESQPPPQDRGAA